YAEYLQEVVCYSIKSESSEGYEQQRIGWLRSQYSSTLLALQRMPIAFLKGEWDYCNKLFQWLLPSRFLLIALIIIGAVLMTFLDWTRCAKWYFLLGTIILTFLLALPEGEVTKRFWRSIGALPILMFSAMFSHITRFFQRKSEKKKGKKKQKPEKATRKMSKPHEDSI
ncbi:MAG: glycosyltransferase, partial [Prevotellaceae bacterium]|nr:glycosyltransferase [Prevotellaceae bacterium]